MPWTDQNNEQLAQQGLNFALQAMALRELAIRMLMKWKVNVVAEGAELKDASAMDASALLGVLQLADKFQAFVDEGTPLDEPLVAQILGRALRNAG